MNLTEQTKHALKIVLLKNYEGTIEDETLRIEKLPATELPSNHWLRRWRFKNEKELNIAMYLYIADQTPSQYIFYKRFLESLVKRNVESLWRKSYIHGIIYKQEVENLLEWMNNFDDAEVCNEEWESKLRESVVLYNQKYGTTFNPGVMYKKWLENLVNQCQN